MTKTASYVDLPFDWAPDMPGCRIVGERKSTAEMMARATDLAVAAMNAQPAVGEVVAFRQARQAEAQAIKAACIQAHQDRNAASHLAALERKAERMNVHSMRNAEAHADAQARKAERIAAHEARNAANRKVA